MRQGTESISTNPASPDVNFALVTTGGTIAGLKTNSSHYQSAKLKGQALADRLGLGDLGTKSGVGSGIGSDVLSDVGSDIRTDISWEVHSPYAIGSQNLTWSEMFTLRELLIQLNADATVHGVLVTHGTDTMEDMLFFLSLTLPDLQKPIVFTGSMLTSDSPNSDAQKNVADSVRLLTVASSAAARGVDNHLVLVKDVPKLFGLVMNGKFTSAHQVQKKCTNGVDAFDLPASLSIDSLIKGQFTASLEVQTNKISLPALSVAQFNTKLQQFVLDLVYCTPNMQVGSISSRIKCLDANQADQVGATSHKTVIVAAPGNGNIPSRFIAELKELMSSGVRVVRASRIAHSPLRQGGELTGLETFVNADLMKVDSSRSPVTFGDYHEALGLSLNQVVIMETCRFLSENSID